MSCSRCAFGSEGGYQGLYVFVGGARGSFSLRGATCFFIVVSLFAIGGVIGVRRGRVPQGKRGVCGEGSKH